MEVSLLSMSRACFGFLLFSICSLNNRHRGQDSVGKEEVCQSLYSPFKASNRGSNVISVRKETCVTSGRCGDGQEIGFTCVCESAYRWLAVELLQL